MLITAIKSTSQQRERSLGPSLVGLSPLQGSRCRLPWSVIIVGDDDDDDDDVDDDDDLYDDDDDDDDDGKPAWVLLTSTLSEDTSRLH